MIARMNLPEIPFPTFLLHELVNFYRIFFYAVLQLGLKGFFIFEIILRLIIYEAKKKNLERPKISSQKDFSDIFVVKEAPEMLFTPKL